MKFTLKQARNYAELSQAEMAKKLHVGLNTYRNYENGISPMRIKTAEMFANFTGVPFDQIIFYSDTTDKMQYFRWIQGGEKAMSDDELLSKMKSYICRKLDQDSDPNAMKAIISEYMHMKGDDYR